MATRFQATSNGFLLLFMLCCATQPSALFAEHASSVDSSDSPDVAAISQLEQVAAIWQPTPSVNASRSTNTPDSVNSSPANEDQLEVMRETGLRDAVARRFTNDKDATHLNALLVSVEQKKQSATDGPQIRMLDRLSGILKEYRSLRFPGSNPDDSEGIRISSKTEDFEITDQKHFSTFINRALTDSQSAAKLKALGLELLIDPARRKPVWVDNHLIVPLPEKGNKSLLVLSRAEFVKLATEVKQQKDDLAILEKANIHVDPKLGLVLPEDRGFLEGQNSPERKALNRLSDGAGDLLAANEINREVKTAPLRQLWDTTAAILKAPAILYLYEKAEQGQAPNASDMIPEPLRRDLSSLARLRRLQSNFGHVTNDETNFSLKETEALLYDRLKTIVDPKKVSAAQKTYEAEFGERQPQEEKKNRASNSVKLSEVRRRQQLEQQLNLIHRELFGSAGEKGLVQDLRESAKAHTQGTFGFGIDGEMLLNGNFSKALVFDDDASTRPSDIAVKGHDTIIRRAINVIGQDLDSPDLAISLRKQLSALYSINSKETAAKAKEFEDEVRRKSVGALIAVSSLGLGTLIQGGRAALFAQTSFRLASNATAAGTAVPFLSRQFFVAKATQTLVGAGIGAGFGGASDLAVQLGGIYDDSRRSSNDPAFNDRAKKISIDLSQTGWSVLHGAGFGAALVQNHAAGQLFGAFGSYQNGKQVADNYRDGNYGQLLANSTTEAGLPVVASVLPKVGARIFERALKLLEQSSTPATNPHVKEELFVPSTENTKIAEISTVNPAEVQKVQQALKDAVSADPELFKKYHVGEKGSGYLPAFDEADLNRVKQTVDHDKRIAELIKSPEQRQVFNDAVADYIADRALGKYAGKTRDALVKSLESHGIAPEALRRVDLDIAAATAYDQRPGIRVFPEGVNPENRPDGVIIAVQGDKPISLPKVQRELSGLLTKSNPRSKTNQATVVIGDIHKGRSDSGNDFENVISVLAKNPPKKIVVLGDVIDSPSFGRKIDAENAARTAKGEPALSEAQIKDIREADLVKYYEEIRRALPDTEIKAILGNHDAGRISQIPSNRPLELALGNGPRSIAFPALKLSDRGRLPNNWLEQLAPQLDEVRSVLGEQAPRTEAEWFDFLKSRGIYTLKGVSARDTYREQAYEDLDFGNRIAEKLRGQRVEFLHLETNEHNGDSSSYYLDGKIAYSHTPGVEGPNIDRAIKPGAGAYAGQGIIPNEVRAVIFGDQHTAFSSRYDAPGRAQPLTVHVVGSISRNSDSGELLMGLVLDEKSGNAYHVTFDRDGAVGEPKLAPAIQINYLTPKLDKSKEVIPLQVVRPEISLLSRIISSAASFPDWMKELIGSGANSSSASPGVSP